VRARVGWGGGVESSCGTEKVSIATSFLEVTFAETTSRESSASVVEICASFLPRAGSSILITNDA
jgi:hypothetical protein